MNEPRRRKLCRASPAGRDELSMAAGASAAAAAAMKAIRFCHSTPSARVACVWPTGHSQVDTARAFLQQQGGEIVHEASVTLADHAHVLLVMALYHGEEWLSSNCYYYESPLPGGPPEGPFAGARWKEELAFRPGADGTTVPPLHVFVFDAKKCRRIDSDKYSCRSSMAGAVGAPGNCCLHLTDDQSDELRKPVAATGAVSIDSGCSSSWAFHCARCVLHPASVRFLNEDSAGGDLTDPTFVSRVEAYASWLCDRSAPDEERGAFTTPSF